MPFYNPAINKIFIEELERLFIPTKNKIIIKADYHINDIQFSNLVLQYWKNLLNVNKKSGERISFNREI